MKNIFTLITICFVSIAFSQKTINASDIMKDIKEGKSVNISNATINGVLDFTFMDEALPKLPKNKSWWNVSKTNTVKKQIASKISFTNCDFKGNVLAYIPHKETGYTFIANFENSIVFKNCTFQKKAMFKYSDFNKETNFSGSKFLDDTTFKYANFKKESLFRNTLFENLASFKYANFKGATDFSHTRFKETADFKYSSFKKGLSFNGTTFEEDLNLKYSKISGEFNITNMKVEYELNTKYTKINGKSYAKFVLNK